MHWVRWGWGGEVVLGAEDLLRDWLRPENVCLLKKQKCNVLQHSLDLLYRWKPEFENLNLSFLSSKPISA